MKCFIVLLAVVGVLADPRIIDWSSEQDVGKPFDESRQKVEESVVDSQQEVEESVVDSQQEVEESAVDGQQEVEESVVDSQQEIENLNIKDDDDDNHPAVIPTSAPLCRINVPALVKLINNVIDKKLASQPVVQMLYLSIPTASRVLSVRKIRGGSFTLGPILNTIKIGNGQTSTTSSILAYRPRYNGYHNTRLGAVFLNLERLFPCAGKKGLVPVCRRFTQEEDGFFKGKTITEAADIGNNMKIFGKDIKTYGFVFERCPLLRGVNKDCLPTHFQTVVTCFLPRSCL